MEIQQYKHEKDLLFSPDAGGYTVPGHLPMAQLFVVGFVAILVMNVIPFES